MDSSTTRSPRPHANHLPENAFPARRPAQVQPHGHDTGALQSVVPHPVNGAGNRRHDSRWDDVRPMPLEEIAAQGQRQHLQYIDMGHYIPVPPAGHVAQQEYHYRDVNNNAGAVHGVPAQVQAVALPAPEVGIFDYAAGQDEAGPDRAFLGEWHQGPVPNDPATEVLRQLASRYLHQPGSQIDMLRMEPGPAGGIRVVITIELADLL